MFILKRSISTRGIKNSASKLVEPYVGIWFTSVALIQFYCNSLLESNFSEHKYNHSIELYGKSLPKLQFVYSKRKVSTKLFYAPKRDEKKFGPKNEATNE